MISTLATPGVAAPCVCAGHAACFVDAAGANAFIMQLSNTALLYVAASYSLVSFFVVSLIFFSLFTIVIVGVDAPVLPPSIVLFIVQLLACIHDMVS